MPLLQLKVLLPVPPVAVTLMLPLDPPLHVTCATVPVSTIGLGAMTVKLCVAVHPAASVAVTVYVPADKLLMVPPEAPLLQENVLLPVPPEAVTVIAPLVNVGQEILTTLPVMAIDEMADMVNPVDAVHPLASVTVAVYDPAAKLLTEFPVAPLLQVTVRVPVPPAVVTTMLPPPLQLGCVAVPEMVSAAGCASVAEAVAVHPLASVTVTEYAPAPKLVRFALVELLLQRYV